MGVAGLAGAAACGADVAAIEGPSDDGGTVEGDADAASGSDATSPTSDGSPTDAGKVDSGSETPTEAGADAGPTCFVPYGCTAYVCDDVSDAGASDGGDAGDGGTLLTGAVPAVGPRGGIDAGADADIDAGVPGANEAYSFQTGDNLIGSDPALPQGASERTLSLWVRPSPGGIQTIFNYGTFASTERFGLLTLNEKDYFVGEGRDLAGNVVLTDGPWHHLAVTYDGTNVSLYVDGTFDKSEVPASALDTQGTTFTIGHTVTVSGREPFHGNVSDIRVYSRVLTTGEIAQLAAFDGQNNPEALRSSTSGLVFWLPLFGGTEVMRNRCAP
jgi:hypothetical protein